MRAVAIVLLASGCGDWATLELSVDYARVDAAADGRYFVVQARRVPITDEPMVSRLAAPVWTPSDDDLDGVLIDSTGLATNRLSIVTKDPATDVRLRVAFCESSRCTNAADATAPSLELHVERPFYLDRTTRVPTAASYADAMNPSAPVLRISRCSVSGCDTARLDPDASGPGTPDAYCDAEGRHFCER